MNEPIPKKPTDSQPISVNKPSTRESSRLPLLGSFFIESSGCVVCETVKRGQRTFAKVEPMSIGELRRKLPATMNMDGSPRKSAADVTGVLHHDGRPLDFVKDASKESPKRVLAARIVWMSKADKITVEKFVRARGKSVPSMSMESEWIELVGDSAVGWYRLDANQETLVLHGSSFYKWLGLAGDREERSLAEQERRASILTQSKSWFDL